MKGFLAWTVAIFFVYLAVTAVDMGEYVIALVMGMIAIGCVWAAPSGQTTKKKGKAGARR